MKKTLKFIFLFGLTLLLGSKFILDLWEEAPTINTGNPEIPMGIAKGDQAPDIEGITLSGDTFHLSDFRGKTVLINVFATWCGPCQIEAPHLAQVYADFEGKDVIFIGLNLEERPEDIANFKFEYGWEFPLVLNQDGLLTEIYQPFGLPTSWFIDPNGVIQYVHTGPVTSEMLPQAITDIQDGRDPNPFKSID